MSNYDKDIEQLKKDVKDLKEFQTAVGAFVVIGQIILLFYLLN